MSRTRNEKRRAELEAELECPPFPMPVLHVYRVFQRLRRRQGGNGFGGLNPITWPDIDAFVRNARMPLAPWEISLIEDLDDIFREKNAAMSE